MYDHKAYCKKYRLEHQEEFKKYRQEHKDRDKAYRRKYYAEHKEQRRLYSRQYKERRNLIRRQRTPEQRLADTLRSRMRSALKGNLKAEHTFELLGCSLEQVRAHLEKQFKPGMSWANWNYRGWHIDHIIPCAFFDLSDPEQQKECFHYTNLQPLWERENNLKRDKVYV